MEHERQVWAAKPEGGRDVAPEVVAEVSPHRLDVVVPGAAVLYVSREVPELHPRRVGAANFEDSPDRMPVPLHRPGREPQIHPAELEELVELYRTTAAICTVQVSLLLKKRLSW